MITYWKSYEKQCEDGMNKEIKMEADVKWEQNLFRSSSSIDHLSLKISVNELQALYTWKLVVCHKLVIFEVIRLLFSSNCIGAQIYWLEEASVGL